MNPISAMPQWYQEITKELKQPRNIPPEKKAIIGYLKEQIRLLEEESN